MPSTCAVTHFVFVFGCEVILVSQSEIGVTSVSIMQFKIYYFLNGTSGLYNTIRQQPENLSDVTRHETLPEDIGL